MHSLLVARLQRAPRTGTQRADGAGLRLRNLGLDPNFRGSQISGLSGSDSSVLPLHGRRVSKRGDTGILGLWSRPLSVPLNNNKGISLLEGVEGGTGSAGGSLGPICWVDG